MTRYWGPNIKIDGTWLREHNDNYTRWVGGGADQWEAEVQDVLRTMERSQCGKLLLQQIDKVKGRSCIIMPIKATQVHQTQMKPSNFTNAVSKGHRLKCPADQFCSKPKPATGTTVHSDLIEGNGTGSSVRVYYHPQTWTVHDQMLGLDTAADNMRPDDVLYHELVHAYRAMIGIFEFVPTGDTWDFSEELFAIMLTNIYVSELGRAGSLRGDHRAEFHALKDVRGPWGTSESDQVFYLSYTRLIDQLCQQMSEITDPLSSLDKPIAAWNPLRVRRRIDQAMKSGMFATVP